MLNRLVTVGFVLLTQTYTSSAAADDVFAEGVQAYRAKDYVLAREKWEEASIASRNPSAENNLAYLMYYGLGEPAKPAKAILLWAVAATYGHAEAQWHLGNAFEDGVALPRDHAKAFAWYRCSIANAERRSLVGDETLERKIGNDARESLAQLRPKLTERMKRRGEEMADECIGRNYESLFDGIDRLMARQRGKDRAGRTSFRSSGASPGDAPVAKKVAQ